MGPFRLPLPPLPPDLKDDLIHLRAAARTLRLAILEHRQGDFLSATAALCVAIERAISRLEP